MRAHSGVGHSHRGIGGLRWLALVLCVGQAVFAGIDLKIEGNSHLSDRRIQEGIASQPESFEKDDLLTWQEDAQFNTSDVYRRNGYFDVQVFLELHPREGGGKEDWDAVMTIREGERYIFDSVRVMAADHRPLVDSSDLKAKSGKPYQEDLVFQDRRFLMQRYGNSGFVHAKIEDKTWLKAKTRTVRVDYLVDPSYPVLFDTLIIRDQRAWPSDSLGGITRESLLRSLVNLEKGDSVRLSSTDRFIEKLQYTGAFNYVRLRDTLLPGPDHRSALTLQLEERTPGNLRTSAFYETYSGFGVSADARHGNVAGSLIELRGGLALASERQNLYAGFGSPLLFGYMIRFDDDASVNWAQGPPVASTQPAFGGDFQAVNSAKLTWPWSYWLRLVGDAQLESKSRMLDPESRERSLNLNFIQTAYIAFLDRTLDPSRGIRVAPSWGNGGPFLEDNEFRLTELRHNWFEVQSGYYDHLSSLSQIKLAVRLDGGRFFGRGGTNSDRFFLGGGRSVRSYEFHELCPETNADTVGASVCSTQSQTLAYFLTSYELRIAPFAFGGRPQTGFMKQLVDLEFVPFYDFGKVWNVEKGFALSGGEGTAHQPHGQGVAMGLGVRYPLLGIFNFRLDLAYKGTHGIEGWPDAWVVDLAQAF